MTEPAAAAAAVGDLAASVDLDLFCARLSALSPEGAFLAAARADAEGAAPLLGAERIAAARMRPGRRAEFAAGRVAARRALAAAGLPGAPIPMGADRAPVWPPGAIGAITHTAGLCLALAARAGGEWSGLGVDLEPAVPLPSDIAAEVLSPAEAAAIGDRRLLATMIFTAKEAAFKAQYPSSRALFGFDGLEITVSTGLLAGADEGWFEARFTRAAPPFAAGAILRGAVLAVGGLIAAQAAAP